LAVSGATGPYSYNWGGGSNSNLVAGAYPVTITDANGCVFESNYSIPFDCPNPCLAADTLFYLDTVYVDLTASLTEFCLPTHETNLEDYDLTLDGVAYNRQIGDCGDATTFYNGFDVLPTPGPYTLVEWTFGNEKQPNIPFTDFEDLVIKMNTWDPFGNWVINQGTIFGGVSGKVYGLMKIRHNASGNALDLQPSKLTIPSPTILLDNHSLTQTLVAMNVWGCSDTLVINVQMPDPATPSTIPVTVEVGGTQQVCIPVDELIGTPEFLSNVGISFTGNAQVLATGDTCVDVVGLEVGVDQATIVICDDFGMCDTTYLIINVIDNSDDILIYTGFSPNGDGVNDFFKIKNIEKYPNNELQIFNRWGKRVYSAKGYKNGWNADYRGIRLTDGTYFYFLTVEIDGETKEYKGFVEVRR
jgi:gliding motility-associated-like protein